MADPLIADFLVNLAAGFTQTLLSAGAGRLKQAALGTDEERALKAALRAGFAALLADVDAQLPTGDLHDENLALVQHIFDSFIRQPSVADNLLALALAGTAPDLAGLAAAFDALDFDRETLAVDFARSLTAYQRGLTAALVGEAAQPGSPLFQQVSLGRSLTIQALLEDQRGSLNAIADSVRRLENAGGQTVYNVVIERVVGPVAIGDRAQAVDRGLPPEVQALLAQVLDSLRRLPPPAPPAYTPDDLRLYLEAVERVCSRLDLVGAGLPVNHLPLERVYVALKADRSSAAERRANRQQLQADWSALEEELNLHDLDEREKLRLQRRFLAGHDPIGLTWAFARRREEEANHTRIDVGQLAARERWAVLLGDPGAGKTTLLRWLGLQFARALLAGKERVQVAAASVRADDSAEDEAEIIDLGPARLPVLLRLADYEGWRWDPETGRDTGRPLIDFLGRQPWLQQSLHPDPATGQALVRDFLGRGRVLLLFDGLDEIVEPGRRGAVAAAVEAFVRSWVSEPESGRTPLDNGALPRGREEARPAHSGGNQLLLTSRPIGYYLAPLDPSIPHYTVEEMGESAVRRFCHAWAGAVHAQSGLGDPEADGAALEAALWKKAGPGLREIVVNPLLLTILAGLHYTLDGPLPERRVQLYDAVAGAFVRQRADAWQAANLGDAHIRYALGYAAAQLHASAAHPNGLVEGEELAEWLEEALEEYEGGYAPRQRAQAQALLDAARSLGGFLLERGQAIYGFVHRTFQEYFAAHYTAANRKEAIDRIVARLDDPAWQEVLALAVAEAVRLHPRQTHALLQAILDAPESLPGLIPQRALFLARCLPELDSVRIPAEVTAAAVAQLAAAYADRAWPPSESSQPPQPLRTAIENALRRLQPLPGATAEISSWLLDAHPTRRLAAAELILQTGWTDPALVAPLLETARTWAEPSASVREALLRCHEQHPEVFSPDLLPLAPLLADGEIVARRWQNPFWQSVLRFLYLHPDHRGEKPLGPDDVLYDSALTPWLATVWTGDWLEARLAEELVSLVTRPGTGGLGRDAGLALAVWQPERLTVLLAALPGEKGEDAGPFGPGVLPLFAWHFDRARDLALALDRDRVEERVAEIHAALAQAQAKLTGAESGPEKEELQTLLSRARDRVESWQDSVGDPLLQQALVGIERLSEATRNEETVSPPDDAPYQRRRLSAERLESASRWERRVHAGLLLPDESEREALVPILTQWARGTDTRLQASGGLLLAEMGEWEAAALGVVAPLLVDGEDLFRYRARQALLADRGAAVWGQEKLEDLARLAAHARTGDGVASASEDGYLIETTCAWALNRVVYDRGEWLQEWVRRYRAGETHLGRLLSSIHKLSDEVWPEFLGLLREGDAPTRSLLLESASWLLRTGQTPVDFLHPLADCLLALAEAEGAVGRDALEALGHFAGVRANDKAIAHIRNELLARSGHAVGDSPLWTALARLAGAKNEDEGAEVRLLSEVELLLAQTPPGPGVDSALARLLVERQKKPGFFGRDEFDPTQPLAELAALRPHPATQLAAFLAAGSDDDGWSESYHGRAAACLSGLVQQHDGLLPALVEDLSGSLDEDHWPRHRMALAGLARLAQDAPGLFNRAGAALQEPLLRASRSPGSFNSRRFAITALSHLREITPAVLAALLRLAGDESVVQRDVIAAAGRFNRLHPSLGEALPAELVAALSGVSSVRAYVAVKVLEALGTSTAARSAPALRGRIVDALAAALRDENSRRPVWLFVDDEIKQEGTLDQHLYAALLRVAGFSG